MKSGFYGLKSLTLSSLLASLIACGGAPDNASSTEGAGGGDSALATGDTSSIKIGVGSGSTFQEGVASSSVVATSSSNVDWAVDIVVVDASDLAVTETYTVTFTSSCTQAGLSTLSATSVETVAGRASVTYSSGTCTGTAGKRA